MSDEEQTVDERLDELERLLRGLTVLSREDARLIAGIERLSDETAGLNEILSRVDEQQRRLAKLDKGVKEIKEQASSAEAEVHHFRARVVRRGGVILGIVVLVVTAGIAGMTEYSRRQAARTTRICQARNAGATVVQDWVTEQIAITRDNTALTPAIRDRQIASLQRLAGSFIVVDCGRAGAEE